MDVWVRVGSPSYRLSWQRMFLIVWAEAVADFIVASEEPCYYMQTSLGIVTTL